MTREREDKIKKIARHYRCLYHDSSNEVSSQNF